MAEPKPFSAGISAAPCPVEGCTCRDVVVRICDAAGRPFAGIVLPRVTAQAFAAQLAEALEGRTAALPSDVQLLRCEGTA